MFMYNLEYRINLISFLVELESCMMGDYLVQFGGN